MENMTKALEVARTLPCACSDCGIRETESAKKILEFAESLSGSAENITKGQQFNLPAAAVFNLQQIALADDDMVKAPGAAEKYRFIARHILELFEASGSVAAPKEEFDKYKFFDQVSAINAKKDLVIESLQSENTALREALKELLPIAENAAYFAGFLPQFTESELDQYENKGKAIIERARNLLNP